MSMVIKSSPDNTAVQSTEPAHRRSFHPLVRTRHESKTDQSEHRSVSLKFHHFNRKRKSHMGKRAQPIIFCIHCKQTEVANRSTGGCSLPVDVSG